MGQLALANRVGALTTRLAIFVPTIIFLEDFLDQPRDEMYDVIQSDDLGVLLLKQFHALF